MLYHMKHKIINKWRDGFLKSIVTLSSSSLLAQLFTFLCAPLLTRLYSEVGIGYFSFILSIETIFSVVICGRYDVSIVNAKREVDVIYLTRLCFLICGILSIVVTAGSYLYIYYFHNDYADLKTIIWFVFPLLMVDGVILILTSHNNRREEYKIISGAYLARSLGQNIMTLVFGALSGLGAFGLLLSQTLGQSLGLMQQAKGVKNKRNYLKKMSWSKIRTVAHEYRAQPLFSAPSSLINALSYSLISINIGSIYGMGILGLYAISVRVLGLPLSIFGTNIAKVHYQKASVERKDKGNFWRCTRDTLVLGVLIAGPLGLCLFFFSPSIFSFVFGESWYQAGVYVQYLIPMYCLRLITGTIGYTFILANRQKSELIFQSCLLGILVLLTLATTINNLKVEHFLTLISFLYSAVYIAEIAIMIKYAKKKEGCEIS